MTEPRDHDAELAHMKAQPGWKPLTDALWLVRGARAYAAIGDRAGVRRVVGHARRYLAFAVQEVDR